MSASPTSPSNRKRQQASATSQPQPIAPAPPAQAAATVARTSATSATVTTQNVAPTPASPPITKTPVAAAPTPINTELAKKTPETASKSPLSPSSARKRKADEMASASEPISTPADQTSEQLAAGLDTKSNLGSSSAAPAAEPPQMQPTPPTKKSRTNTPWTPAEERKLKTLRDAGSSWGEIAKEFPHRTEGSVKKHWYKDMHYADFAEDESAALLAAIREYEANKWKEIGKKVGKPAKACEQYAKEHFSGKL